MTVTATIDGAPRTVVCPTCHAPLTRDAELGLWYLICDSDNNHLWQLDTALRQQPAVVIDTPKSVRRTDPPTSRQATRIPSGTRHQEVLNAITALGPATAYDIAAWVNDDRRRGNPTAKGDVSKRAGELARAGVISESGTRVNETGAEAIVYAYSRQQTLKVAA